MPEISSSGAAAIQAGAQVVGAGIDAYATANLNKRSRQFAQKMYDLQKTDNIEFWRMQNEYNSPAAQMQRFQDAKLNPNLIYGQGNSGNAGAISTPDVQQPQWKVPDVGGFIGRAGGAIGTYLDYEIKQAQIDNLRVDNTIKMEDVQLRRAQIRATMTDAERREFDLSLERSSLGYSLDARRESVRKMKTETDVLLNRDERETAMNSSNLREAAQRILSMRQSRAQSREEMNRIRAATKDILSSNQLKQMDIDLRKLGIQPSDPLWARMLGRLLNLDDFGNFNQGSENPYYRNGKLKGLNR